MWHSLYVVTKEQLCDVGPFLLFHVGFWDWIQIFGYSGTNVQEVIYMSLVLADLDLTPYLYISSCFDFFREKYTIII